MKNYSNWMTDNLEILGGKKIKELTLPASHDSGMSVITQSTSFSNNCNTQTQKYSFTEQLTAGVRYFDLRPIIGGGEFYTGHYTQGKIEGEKFIVGSRGLLIDDFISQVNCFTEKHKEMIIINVSHAYNTDNASRAEEWEFNSSEWNRLLNKFKLLNNRSKEKVNRLSDKKLNQFTGTKGVVLLFLTGLNVPVSDLSDGMYPVSKLGLVRKDKEDEKDKRKSTIDVNDMVEYQLDQMKKYYKNGLFKLSWTLTMQFQQALAASVHPKEAKSIQSYAEEAWREIDKGVLQMTKNIYPNLISIDFSDDILTEKCIALNLNRFKNN
ncbi:hypothetical protein CXF68_01215 [Tenacibaculum sp. Bg11-29]|uniref:hypothetical protein n=1 Tax=Tenacibaculum sp. Bg11-29 TaxID=2058306 RepID=UPI000C3482E6|nr:hypothetical protein [Tenacibaculum sp. Bg11-29]PKH49388.1 hypothetical protein CXF68_01215 [Tenacibaculum sp. Bg11-29]